MKTHARAARRKLARKAERGRIAARTRRIWLARYGNSATDWIELPWMTVPAVPWDAPVNCTPPAEMMRVRFLGHHLKEVGPGVWQNTIRFESGGRID